MGYGESVTKGMSKGLTRRRITARPSETVVAALAENADVDPLEFDVPLYEAIDPDALDALFEGSETAQLRVTFTYESYDVTVEGEHCYVEARSDR